MQENVKLQDQDIERRSSVPDSQQGSGLAGISQGADAKFLSRTLPHGARIVSAVKTDSADLEIPTTICTLFRAQYGSSYPNPSAYDPHQLVAEWRSGKVVSCVLPRGQLGADVVSHAAIIDLGERVLEIGKIIVSRESQGGGFGAKVTEAALAYARVLKPNLLLAWTYTAHLFSQRIFDKLGFQPIGLMVGDWPDVFNTGSRDGALVVADPTMVRYQAPREVFVPDSLKPVLKFAYACLGCDRTFAKGARDSGIGTSPLPIVPSVDRADFAKTRSMAVFIPPGADRQGAMTLIDALIAESPEHIGVRVNIGDGQSLSIVSALAQRGFFFGLVQPYEHGDILTMQRTALGFDASTEKLKLHADSAKELFRLIQQSVRDGKNS